MKHLRNGVTAAMLAVMGLFLAGCPGTGGIVTFPDKNLELAIRSQLAKPFGFLMLSDLQSLQVLDARGFGITNLTGLELATNLQALILSNNNVADLRPLTNLLVLQDLELDDNPVFDLTPLQGVLSLRALSLCGTSVRSLTPLVINSDNGGLGPTDRVVVDDEIRDADAGNIAALEANSVSVVDCAGGGSR